MLSLLLDEFGISLMKIKVFILAFFATSGSAMADIPPIKYKTVWDGQVEPVSVIADPTNATPIAVEMDTSKEDKLFQKYLAELNITYAPKVHFYLYLPLDIADTKIGFVKVGYESRSELSDKKDKLSVFLAQNEEARHYVGLYKQRILGWSEGFTPWGVTIGKAVLEEAEFPILDMVLTPETTTPERIKYFEKRLSLQHLSALQRWLETTEDKTSSRTLAEILAKSLVDQKMYLGN